MRIKVRLIGVLKRACRKDEFQVDLDEGLSLRDVILKLIENERVLENLILDPELKDPRPNTIILINGREMNVLKGLETEIKNGDEITIIPVIHGGYKTLSGNILKPSGTSQRESKDRYKRVRFASVNLIGVEGRGKS
jgi:molybdopterin synthase sulfur carrier subunit